MTLIDSRHSTPLDGAPALKRAHECLPGAVTGGRYGGARYPGGEWAARALAYVFTISAFKSWKALIRTILKGMLRDSL